MLDTPDRNTRSLFIRLVEEELGFCCVYSFLKETSRYSMHKIAQAMGVSTNTVRYWREKKFREQVVSCPLCPHPRIQLQLNQTSDGRVYFVRSYSY